MSGKGGRTDGYREEKTTVVSEAAQKLSFTKCSDELATQAE